MDSLGGGVKDLDRLRDRLLAQLAVTGGEPSAS